MRLPTSQAARPGLSLLEVLVALTIFLLSLVAISRLVEMGGERALEARERVQAAQLCESKMNEVVAGVVPLQSQGDTPFDEDPDWVWSLDCDQGAITNLWNVTVKVSRQQGQGNRTPISVSLSQMLLDPSIRGNAYDAASGSSSSSGSSTSTGTSSSTSP
jgi:type II secretion system protein I